MILWTKSRRLASGRPFGRLARTLIGRRCIAVALAALTTFLLVSTGDGEEKEKKTERRRAQLLEQMRSLAQQTKVRVKGEAERPLELVKNPVFRYDDQPRRFIDATMWVWTQAGRPVAFQKIEAKYHVENDRPQWGYCFTSVTPDLVSVEWAADRAYRSTEPGIDFSVLSEAPAVADGSAQRKRQVRELARKFSARTVLNPRDNVTQEMRLLTTPIFDYADPLTKSFLGAVFAFSTNGTNPDLLILLEVRGEKDKPQWHFAPARMTSGGVLLSYQKEKVWETSWVNWTDAPFPTWTFFATPREPVRDE